MTSETELLEKRRKIEALCAGAGTAGERDAAEAALGRIKARLAEQGQRNPPIERKFSMPGQWSQRLFLALCRRYGLRPYRYFRQKHTTIWSDYRRTSSTKFCGLSLLNLTRFCTGICTT